MYKNLFICRTYSEEWNLQLLSNLTLPIKLLSKSSALICRPVWLKDACNNHNTTKREQHQFMKKAKLAAKQFQTVTPKCTENYFPKKTFFLLFLIHNNTYINRNTKSSSFFQQFWFLRFRLLLLFDISIHFIILLLCLNKFRIG